MMALLVCLALGAEAADGGATAVAPPPVQPPALTGAALAQELKKHAQEQKAHRSKLDEERKALDAEHAKLEALKKEIDDSRAALREETARLEAMLPHSGAAAAPVKPAGPVPANPGAQLKPLAKALKGMKPEQAAAVLTRLERPLAAQLLRELKPNEAAVVLEKLKPELAAELVSTLAAAPAARKDVL
jgi:flagellar motility protein MotE (MotC chaperone)